MKPILLVIALVAILFLSSCGPATRVSVGTGYRSYYGPRPYYRPRPYYNPYYYHSYHSWGYPHHRGYYHR